jgi:hypothetical protein
MTEHRQLVIDALSRRIEKLHAEMDEAWRTALELDNARDERTDAPSRQEPE